MRLVQLVQQLVFNEFVSLVKYDELFDKFLLQYPSVCSVGSVSSKGSYSSTTASSLRKWCNGERTREDKNERDDEEAANVRPNTINSLWDRVDTQYTVKTSLKQFRSIKTLYFFNSKLYKYLISWILFSFFKFLLAN